MTNGRKQKREDSHFKVSMLVCNTFLNDARVLKEAETLVQAGYQVTVNALALPGVAPGLEVLSSGIRVRRHGASYTKGEGKTESSKQERSKERSKFEVLALMASQGRALMSMTWSTFRARPDIIHAHDVNMLPSAWLAARLAKAPLIYDAHEISTDREGYKAIRGVVGWIEKKLMPTAAGTITTTDARAKFFARAYHIERPLVLQNRPRLVKVEGSNRIREELALKEPWPIALYQGGLQPGRGLPRLVEAAAHVPQTYFVFIGGGRQASELHQLAEKLELTERVYFISTVPLAALPAYTASADIGVQPIENTCLNHFTTDSNKLFEYVIAGLPVVASQLPEISKVVREHDLGLLVPPGDTQALADAIQTLVQNLEMRKQYSFNAGLAAQSLNWETQEQSLLDLYAKILPINGGMELQG
ncbi:glycosyltransferase family 4 protein [Halomonas sp. HAL1]|uniref:glycosyltransferase family 4 protein n=1 Tax=Halomonas sp. HAL1 TaxID=550984 RepID=UPI00022D3308|nr:glycosyltransferase family 4 protein [Halomonas sp. HAL1]EHA13923.1 glycosyl transferase group 1 protein [Halomonas sp. HAL1]WKV94270.1 glycosyltransferase family 4 protein [Halomonas sp. HAL1]